MIPRVDPDRTPRFLHRTAALGAGAPGRRASATGRHRHRTVAAALVGLAFSLGPTGPAATEDATSPNPGPGLDAGAVMGPGECAECHEKTARIWERTLHHALFRQTHRSREGTSFAKKLRVRRIKGATGLCASCHYTVRMGRKRPRSVAGVSCESCHGASRDWIKVHSEFSGKEKETESPEEAKERWAKSEAAGMIRPRNLYALAKNCHTCHSTAHEELINVGGHPQGSGFELLSWTMGEVRHNVWHTDSNDEATPERKRMLYLAGLSLTLETALEALSAVREPHGKYATEMRARAAGASDKLTEASRLLPDVPELKVMVGAAEPIATGAEELRSSAATVAAQARSLLERDGKGLGAIDGMLPGADDYVGKVADP